MEGTIIFISPSLFFILSRPPFLPPLSFIIRPSFFLLGHTFYFAVLFLSGRPFFISFCHTFSISPSLFISSSFLFRFPRLFYFAVPFSFPRLFYFAVPFLFPRLFYFAVPSSFPVRLCVRMHSIESGAARRSHCSACQAENPRFVRNTKCIPPSTGIVNGPRKKYLHSKNYDDIQ